MDWLCIASVSGWCQRTGIINQIRAFLLERGIAVRQGQRFLLQALVRPVDQRKTEGGEQAHLEIPVHPKLREIIDSTPSDHLTFLVTSFGKPYSSNGFGNSMREWCDAAGCSDVSSHGLRKACARRLAEIGCTTHEIASITGQASLSEAERYTRAANRNRLAQSAMTKLLEGES